MYGQIKKNETEKLDVYLNENYPEIALAIKKEKYNLDILNFDTLMEITFKNKVVGFIAIQNFHLDETIFLITDAYIIPQFRGHNLLFNLLSDLKTMDNFEYYPLNPTKAFINVLLKNDYAFKISRNLVVSYLEFMIDGNVLKNPKIKRFYTNSSFPLPYKSDVFDLELCSVMFRDPFNKIVKYDDFFGLLEPRAYDRRKYKTSRKFKRVNEKYIDDKFRAWHKNQKKIISFIDRKDKEFKDSLIVENFIGSENKLDDEFVKFLKLNKFSVEDGFKIRKHIVGRLNTGELTKMSYRQRIYYLMRNIGDIDRKLNLDDENCPFCGIPIPKFAKSCLNCGFNVEFFIDENINELSEKVFDKMFGDVVEIKENDEHKNLKIFFNEYMRDYDFDEFLEYYNKYAEVLDLEDIKDMFLEEKLIKSLESGNEYKTYYFNINHYLYCYFEKEELDLAFVKFIQLLILISNKKTDETSLINSDPQTFFSSEVFKEVDYEFNIGELFNQAVDTFRIEKYNINHEKVLKEIKNIFDDN